MMTLFVLACLHLYNEHGILADFDDCYTFHVLDHVSPKQMEKAEHLWIHRLNTLFPSGLNRSNPFSIPILNCSSVEIIIRVSKIT